MKRMTFALCFCNRGFMPGELIYGAREDMIRAVTDAGYDYIAMDAELTRYGGVETRDEGKVPSFLIYSARQIVSPVILVGAGFQPWNI